MVQTGIIISPILATGVSYAAAGDDYYDTPIWSPTSLLINLAMFGYGGWVGAAVPVRSQKGRCQRNPFFSAPGANEIPSFLDLVPTTGLVPMKSLLFWAWCRRRGRCQWNPFFFGPGANEIPSFLGLVPTTGPVPMKSLLFWAWCPRFG